MPVAVFPSTANKPPLSTSTARRRCRRPAWCGAGPRRFGVRRAAVMLRLVAALNRATCSSYETTALSKSASFPPAPTPSPLLLVSVGAT